LDGNRILAELYGIKVLTGLTLNLIGMLIDKVLDEGGVGQFAIDGRCAASDGVGSALERFHLLLFVSFLLIVQGDTLQYLTPSDGFH
jgi:hypothetical protein